MCKLEELIKNADKCHIDAIIHALLCRYKELYPDWELHIVSLPKTPDRNEMIDSNIRLLQGLKQQ